MTSVREALEDYLRVRRRLGFQLKTEQPLLESFVEFMEQAGAGRITSELAVKWAMLPQDAHPHRWGQRLMIVRVFARYVATLDPDSEIPSVDLLPARRPRVAPYIYSPEEITTLMKAAGQLTPPMRAALRRHNHDLRHSFAVKTLLGWYRDGDDVAARMPLLSTYMGHVDPAASYWYLSAAPELLGLAAKRLGQATGGRS